LVAAFDTAFHRTLPQRAWRYALPELPGVRRYGFHGWSHRSVTERYAELSGNPLPTIVTLHLRSGCSAAAIQRGQSIDTSMGYTPLEGLVMGTRPGNLDPGILTHLLQQGMTLDRLRRLLHQESGLQGLAGSQDMRELLRRDDEKAVAALEIFCYRILKYVGACLTILGGAEAIVIYGRYRRELARAQAPNMRGAELGRAGDGWLPECPGEERISAEGTVTLTLPPPESQELQGQRQDGRPIMKWR
jgi:acetate kinase